MCRVETVNLSEAGIALIMFEDEMTRNQNKINRLSAEIRAKSQELQMIADRQRSLQQTIVRLGQTVARERSFCYNINTR